MSMRTHWNDPTLPHPWHAIQRVEVTSATTEITFSGLDHDAHKAYRIMAGLRAGGSSFSTDIYVNNDTTNTNYRSQELRVTGSTVSPQRRTRPGPLIRTPANQTSQLVLDIQWFDNRFAFQSMATSHETLNQFRRFSGFRMGSTSDITSLHLRSSTSNAIQTGSIAYLLAAGGFD
jgi:hypothetical protein